VDVLANHDKGTMAKEEMPGQGRNAGQRRRQSQLKHQEMIIHLSLSKRFFILVKQLSTSLPPTTEVMRAVAIIPFDSTTQSRIFMLDQPTSRYYS
jgi:hypothetical protein